MRGLLLTAICNPPDIQSDDCTHCAKGQRVEHGYIQAELRYNSINPLLPTLRKSGEFSICAPCEKARRKRDQNSERNHESGNQRMIPFTTPTDVQPKPDR